MRYNELTRYIKDNNLLQQVDRGAGIYAITLDGSIVYIGQSVNMFQRCSQHVYGVENAMLSKEKKYLLLLSAKLGGHNIDYIVLQHCHEDELSYWENQQIEQHKPCLNIQYPGGRQDISNMRIEDLLSNIK